MICGAQVGQIMRTHEDASFGLRVGVVCVAESQSTVSPISIMV
jgi:hypothetical protein